MTWIDAVTMLGLGTVLGALSFILGYEYSRWNERRDEPPAGEV